MKAQKRTQGDTGQWGNPFGGWFPWHTFARCQKCGKAGSVQTRDDARGRWWRCGSPECQDDRPTLAPLKLSCCGVERGQSHEVWCAFRVEVLMMEETS